MVRSSLFTGKLRNHNLGDEVNTLTLEHYPGMTEKALNDIVEQAHARVEAFTKSQR